MLCLMEKILKDGMMPVAGLNIQNTPSINLVGELGLVEAFDTTWILYSISKKQLAIASYNIIM